MGVCRGVGVVQQYPSLSFKKSSTLSSGVGGGGGGGGGGVGGCCSACICPASLQAKAIDPCATSI